jgi:drug/metabolite transporter (DMT)-like permease
MTSDGGLDSRPGRLPFGGDPDPVSRPEPLTVAVTTYQAVWVVGLTFLLWVGLVKTYSASKLSAFTFITPLFGVVASYFILHDTLDPVFGAAALLVIAGLFPVNRPSPGIPVPTDPLLTVTKT